MKTLKTFVFLLFALAIVSTTLYGLVKVDTITYDHITHKYVLLPAGTTVVINGIYGEVCVVSWDNHFAWIPCANMYFMGRWGRGVMPSARLK